MKRRLLPKHFQRLPPTTARPTIPPRPADNSIFAASRRRGCPRQIPPCFLRRSLGQRPSAAVPRIPASSVISRYPLREADFRFSSLCFFLIRRLWKPSDRGLSAFYSEIPQNGNDSLHGTHDGFLILLLLSSQTSVGLKTFNRWSAYASTVVIAALALYAGHYFLGVTEWRTWVDVTASVSYVAAGLPFIYPTAA